MKYVFILVVQVFFVISLVAQKSTFEKTGTLNMQSDQQSVNVQTLPVIASLKSFCSKNKFRLKLFPSNEYLVLSEIQVSLIF